MFDDANFKSCQVHFLSSTTLPVPKSNSWGYLINIKGTLLFYSNNQRVYALNWPGVRHLGVWWSTAFDFNWLQMSQLKSKWAILYFKDDPLLKIYIFFISSVGKKMALGPSSTATGGMTESIERSDFSNNISVYIRTYRGKECMSSSQGQLWHRATFIFGICQITGPSSHVILTRQQCSARISNRSADNQARGAKTQATFYQYTQPGPMLLNNTQGAHSLKEPCFR